MSFLTERTKDAMLFPRPGAGETVEISPPGLCWLPAEGAEGYRVEIRDAGGATVYEKEVGADPVHLPDRVLRPGDYTWDVASLDASGSEAARRGIQRFTIADDSPELPWVEPRELLDRVPDGHPRLLYPRAALSDLRTSLHTTRKKTWEACLRGAERALDTPAPEFPDYHLAKDPKVARLAYKDYFAYFRQFINNALMHLSVAWLMTEETKYADAAKRILLEVTGWPTDDDDVTSVSAQWGDEPGLSFSRCVHRAYDWLYDALSEDERASVLKMCEERAWQTYRRLDRVDYLTTPGRSHDGRLIAYLSEMAIVMAGEAEGAETWLDYSLKGLTTFYPHWGGYEGGWAEGVNYGLGYNTVYLPALEGLRIACDFDIWKRPFFRKVRHFYLFSTSPRGEISPFGDGAERGGPGGGRGGGYAGLMRHHAHTYDDPHAGWYVEQVVGDAAESRELSVGNELSLLFEDEMPSGPPTDLPSSRAFRGVGWAGLHSDLADPERDTFLLFKSSPYGSVSHSHADQNAFVIMKGGTALAIPSGYYGPAYGQPHHALWTRSTKANNCVLVNGEGQTIREQSACGRITAFEERTGMSYVAGDAAAAYSGKLVRFDRHILLLRPGLILMLDDLEGSDSAHFQWMLHAFDAMEVDPAKNSIRSARKEAALDVYLQSPAGIGLSQTDQFDTPYNHDIPEQFYKDLPNHWHVTGETRDQAKAVRIAAAMSVTGPGESIDVEILDHAGWFGARAAGEFGTTEGWVQLEKGAAGPEGYGDEVADGTVVVCGTGADGEKLQRGNGKSNGGMGK